MTQDERLPWPGWSCERLAHGLLEGDMFQLDLSIDGPGEVFSFMDDPVGMPVARYVDTTDAAPDRIPVGIDGADTTYEAGDVVTLTANQDPPTEHDTYDWAIRWPGEDTFEAVSGVPAGPTPSPPPTGTTAPRCWSASATPPSRPGIWAGALASTTAPRPVRTSPPDQTCHRDSTPAMAWA